MNMKLFAAAAATSVLLAAAPAQAAVLQANVGWVNDSISAAGVPSDGSAWTFTVTETSIFSLVDCCIAGDSYLLFGDLTGVTSFFAGDSMDIQADGAGDFGLTYSANWLDASYAKLTYQVAPGTYSFSVIGDGAAGTPADFAIRLDSAIPEASTWAMMILGLGFAGAALRRRNTSVTVSYA